MGGRGGGGGSVQNCFAMPGFHWQSGTPLCGLVGRGGGGGGRNVSECGEVEGGSVWGDEGRGCVGRGWGEEVSVWGGVGEVSVWGGGGGGSECVGRGWGRK